MPAPASLGKLLADRSIRADKASAFGSLYARWQIDYDGRGATGCERGRSEGLQCLFKTGTWARLRRYDLPAVIELAGPAGDRRYATLVALANDRATLDLGGRAHTFSLRDIDPYWEGGFVLLWKAPAVAAMSIAPGARGRDVEWVRQRLAELDGTPASARNRDVFDDELRTRVIAFQRGASLVADGIVGEETLIQLSRGQRDPRTPRLSQPGT